MSKNFNNIPYSVYKDQPFKFWILESFTRLKEATLVRYFYFPGPDIRNIVLAIVTILFWISFPIVVLSVKYLILKQIKEESRAVTIYHPANINRFIVMSELMPAKD